MTKRLLLLIALIFCLSRSAGAGACPASVPSGITTCFYIDYTSGSDSNDGASEASGHPWKHAPGMVGLTPGGASSGDGCTANCASHTPTPGEGFILKGGVVWPYTALPWNWTWAGTSTGSTYGCTGSGCIYIGYDPTWNAGVVNSVTLTRDLGGCNPSSAPTVAFSGGGGSGAAATAHVISSAAGTQEPHIAGLVYLITVTNQGSGYTSNPSVTISGDSCTGITAAADIQRPVLDAGSASNIQWPVGNGPDAPDGIYSPSPHFTDYNIVDHIEFRNLLQIARCATAPCMVGCDTASDGIGFTTIFFIGYHSTIENTYAHGRHSTCSADANQETADKGITYRAGSEVTGNILSNGEDYTYGVYAACNGGPCAFSEFSISGISGEDNTGEIQHNHSYVTTWMTHVGGSSQTAPILIHDNEFWLGVYNQGGEHENELYTLMQGGSPQWYLYEYNNVIHSAIGGSSNQQQTGGGTIQYFFNNVEWYMGNGTDAWDFESDGNNGTANTAYSFNNTVFGSDSTNAATRTCMGEGGFGAFPNTFTAYWQNNHCISSAIPYWAAGSGAIDKNYAGSTTQATIEASSTVQSSSTATSQGYVIGNLFAPTRSINDTVTFASNANSANLTSLCSGYLVPLCSDINGNPRPSSGGWQSGAYYYGSGGSSQSAPVAPTGLTALVQ